MTVERSRSRERRTGVIDAARRWKARGGDRTYTGNGHRVSTRAAGEDRLSSMCKTPGTEGIRK